MKNQYVGDINDFKKYGLLRVILRETRFKLLVSWMLTQDDEGGDGRLRSHLKHPRKYRDCDPELWDALKELTDRPERVGVEDVERSGLLKDATFYGALVPDARDRRAAWHRGLLEAAGGRDLVFLDPDNGLEVRSKSPGSRGFSKYAAWVDLEALWVRGHSTLLYQHFPREERERYIARMRNGLCERIGAKHVLAVRTANVLFLLIPQPRHLELLAGALQVASDRWGRLFTLAK